MLSGSSPSQCPRHFTPSQSDTGKHALWEYIWEICPNVKIKMGCYVFPVQFQYCPISEHNIAHCIPLIHTLDKGLVLHLLITTSPLQQLFSIKQKAAMNTIKSPPKPYRPLFNKILSRFGHSSFFGVGEKSSPCLCVWTPPLQNNSFCIEREQLFQYGSSRFCAFFILQGVCCT
ncbi:hypothetical protein GDO86_013847 [Hymenochirus boettgeri]|uniref:Uncharacterized protein n=1 Tax=Hymenochirus boettgeri TaxID=247094 RepID=A0A8T2JPC0_9PIPI|nr:hypothetical protein GDO86_013847 [Hymenochirus boettgeri]